MNGQLKVKFNMSDYERSLEILICVEEQGIITHVAKPVELELQPVEGAIEPTISISRRLEAETFLKSLGDELARLGKKPDPDAKLEGTLEATRNHLNDLRTMLGMDDPKCEKRLTINRSQ